MLRLQMHKIMWYMLEKCFLHDCDLFKEQHISSSSVLTQIFVIISWSSSECHYKQIMVFACVRTPGKLHVFGDFDTKLEVFSHQDVVSLVMMTSIWAILSPSS